LYPNKPKITPENQSNKNDEFHKALFKTRNKDHETHDINKILFKRSKNESFFNKSFKENNAIKLSKICVKFACKKECVKNEMMLGLFFNHK
jgi:hypothetical protein